MADRSVSVSLRANVNDFVARMRVAGRAVDRLAASFEEHGKGMQGGMMSSAAAAASLAAPIAAAGTAVAAFGAVAIPTIAKVITAQENLADHWTTLSPRQKAAAVDVNRLSDQYKKLAKSYEPQTLGAFNTVVATGAAMLPKLDKVVGQTATGVQGLVERFAGFVSGKEVDGFLSFAAANAPMALSQLGTTMTTTGSLALSLIQDLAPMGFSLLSATNGALGLVNGLAHMNPLLAQMAVMGLMLRGPVTGLVTGIGNMTGRIRSAATAMQGMNRSQKVMHLLTAAGPGLYIAAAAAIGFFAYKALTAKTSTEKLIEVLKIQNRAVGNNIAGYGALANDLEHRLAKSLNRTWFSVRQTTIDGQKMTIVVDDLTGTVKFLSKEQQTLANGITEANHKIQVINQSAGRLAAQYSITTAQARRLADAAGVDLTSAFDKHGKLTAIAAQKIDQYRQAVELAKDPTRLIKLALDDAGNSALQMKDRVTALSTALDAIFNPSISVFKATTQLKAGMVDLISTLSDATRKYGRHRNLMDGNSVASRALRNAFASQLETVRDLRTAIFQQTGSLSKANSSTARYLPVLYAMTGGSKSARSQIDALARSMGIATGRMNISRTAFLKAASAMGIARGRAADLWKQLLKIRNRDVSLKVAANGTWTEARAATHSYYGGPITGAGQPGASRHRDSVHGLLRVDEHVWTPEEVDSVGGHGAMYRLRAAARRGELQGYYAGGRVGLGNTTMSTAQTTGVVMKPITDGYQHMYLTLAQALANAWKKFAASGGPVVAAARSMIGLPYSWGGGGLGGPSYGIGRGARTFGFDCSGLTEYAWGKGRGIDIGGVTDSQWASSTPISGPRPGALAFPSGPSVHVMLGSSKPGYVIQAPYTGSYVQEVSRSSGNWRWPHAAGYAAGGPVRRLGAEATSLRASADAQALAQLLQIAGGAPRPGERHTAQIAPAGLRVWAEPETQGEAYIPLAPSKRLRSKAVLASVARRFGFGLTRMSGGGILGFADGGLTDAPPLNLGEYLQRWTDTVTPASKSDVDKARKAQLAQREQVRKAELALRHAEKAREERIRKAEERLRRAQRSHDPQRIREAKADLKKARDTDRIREAERKLKLERQQLGEATKKLRETEGRYQYAKLSPAKQLGQALGLGIKNTGAFIANLTTLADRGYGTLARELLTMGGPEAEKIAASAVKMSDAELRGLQGKVNKAKQQQALLGNLDNVLNVRAAMKRLGAKRSGSWTALLEATGLDPGTLAIAVRLIPGLGKTASGRALLADMRKHGYARGGWVGGPGGVDNVPLMATRGEYVVNRRAAMRHAPLVEAINSDQVGTAFLRRYVRGGWAGPVRGGDGSNAGTQVTNYFHYQELDTPQLAREVGREVAWQLH